MAFLSNCIHFVLDLYNLVYKRGIYLKVTYHTNGGCVVIVEKEHTPEIELAVWIYDPTSKGLDIEGKSN